MRKLLCTMIIFVGMNAYANDCVKNVEIQIKKTQIVKEFLSNSKADIKWAVENQNIELGERTRKELDALDSSLRSIANRVCYI